MSTAMSKGSGYARATMFSVADTMETMSRCSAYDWVSTVARAALEMGFMPERFRKSVAKKTCSPSARTTFFGVADTMETMIRFPAGWMIQTPDTPRLYRSR